VATARNGVALHLADRGLQRAPEVEEVVGVAAHHPVVPHGVPHGSLLSRGTPLGELLEVVAGAEGSTLAREHDDVDLGVVVGPLDGRPDLAGHGDVDGVEPLGPIERDAGLAPVDLVADAAELRIGHLLMTVTLAMKAPSLLKSPVSFGPRNRCPTSAATKWSEEPTLNGEPSAPTLPMRPPWWGA